jgi:glycosyltransferase involved in cell wall biosynthesis
MRLLHVVASGQRRGAELFASDLVRALGADGVLQHVAVLHGREPIGFPLAAPMTIVSGDGTSTSPLPVRPAILTGLRKLIRGLRPQLIQAHGGEPLKYTILAANNSGARVVYRRIGSAAGRDVRGARRALHGRLMRRADRVIAVAEALRRETVVTFGVHPDRVVTIPNAIDPGRMRPKRSREEVRRSLGVGPADPVVLTLGALTWEKDPLGHIDVMARVFRQHPGAVHLIVGDGPLQGDVVHAIRRQGLEDRVFVLGVRSDVADLVSAVDVLLIASLTEGMPGCIIEAGLRGVPTVAYALSGIPELVDSGVTGLTAPPGRSDRLAACLSALLTDRGARHRMGAAARDRYGSSFDIRTIAPRYLSLYEELIRP